MYLLTLKVTTYCLKLKTHVLQKSTGDNVKMIIVNCSNIVMSNTYQYLGTKLLFSCPRSVYEVLLKKKTTKTRRFLNFAVCQAAVKTT